MIVLAANLGTPENAAVREFLAERRDDAQVSLVRRLKRGIADGDLPKGTDTVAIADVLQHRAAGPVVPVAQRRHAQEHAPHCRQRHGGVGRAGKTGDP